MTIDISEVKKSLFAVLKDATKVNEYLRRYGPVIDVKNVDALNEAVVRRSRRREDELASGNDPIYTVTVSCPVCNQTGITGYELHAKSLAITQNKFLVPAYSATSDYRAVDYTLLSVTVCPRCLFASPDKKDFSRPCAETAIDTKSRLTSNVIMSLQERIGERKGLVKGISDYKRYFDRPRVDQAALDSYRLAMARAKVETWHELPYAYFKLGSYAARMAKILKETGVNTTEMLRTALAYFEESFMRSDCPSEEIELQSLYLIVALSAKVGELRKAKTYTGAFIHLYADNNAREKRPATEHTAPPALIGLWKDKIELVRDNMDDPEFFKNE